MTEHKKRYSVFPDTKPPKTSKAKTKRFDEEPDKVVKQVNIFVYILMIIACIVLLSLFVFHG